MDTKSFEAALTEFDQLAICEYHEDLKSILKDSNADRRQLRLARLTGILIKQPFADPGELPRASPHTGAFRGWELKTQEHFAEACASNPGPYRFLESVHMEVEGSGIKGLPATYNFALHCQFETGFYAYFVRALGKYICGDKEIRTKVKDMLKSAKLPEITPETIVAGGGMALGAYLVSAVPILALAGAPIIAAVVVVLYATGVDAFCNASNFAQTNRIEQ